MDSSCRTKGGCVKNERLPGDFRVLVVDDHKISRRYTVAALRQSRASVKQARNVRSALKLALDWCPRLIFMDIHLRGRSGLNLIQRIRRHWPTQLSQPRIVVLSADPSGPGRSEIERLDIDQVLIKPVRSAQIRHAAKIHRRQEIIESRDPEPELHWLFRQELDRRLPELDRCMGDLDLLGVRGILHQLIASSAICRESRLEASMRKLDNGCQENEPPTELAMAYYQLLASSRDYLQGTRRSG